MRRVVFLDTGILGMITNPRKYPEVRAWLQRLGTAGIEVWVPEIADYELRRELLRRGARIRLQRLDELKQIGNYQPITTDAMLQAAAFWAQARNQRYQTADNTSLDADVILAAQAATFNASGCQVEVVTLNVGHLSRYGISAKPWDQVP
jgi:predicted nucleic acid-binding protein